MNEVHVHVYIAIGWYYVCTSVSIAHSITIHIHTIIIMCTLLSKSMWNCATLTNVSQMCVHTCTYIPQLSGLQNTHWWLYKGKKLPPHWPLHNTLYVHGDCLKRESSQLRNPGMGERVIKLESCPENSLCSSDTTLLMRKRPSWIPDKPVIVHVWSYIH